MTLLSYLENKVPKMVQNIIRTLLSRLQETPCAEICPLVLAVVEKRMLSPAEHAAFSQKETTFPPLAFPSGTIIGTD